MVVEITFWLHGLAIIMNVLFCIVDDKNLAKVGLIEFKKLVGKNKTPNIYQ